METRIVGIDVGGTFTDLYAIDAQAGDLRVLKVPSTPHDPSVGLLAALEAAAFDPASVAALVHGTTIATNAIIERAGARCALITTRGFRDILELGRRDRPQPFGLTGAHEPLIPRDRRWEVDERLDHEGRVVTPLDDEEVRRLGLSLLEDKIECVVIALIHAYADPRHEDRMAQLLRELNPRWHIVKSSAVLREYYEFERTSTAAVQGYLQPLVAGYADALAGRLNEYGLRRDILVMQSNGGVIPVSQLGERAAHIIRSGPAAGVIAAVRVAEEAGFDKVITGDMGGTSFDVAIAVAGEAAVAETTHLDFRVPVRLPMIDVHTIGAGGGSIAWIDRAGLLQVGPRSAGASPGPVCYGLGGTEVTTTDANVVLGRINPAAPIGGTLRSFDVKAARTAIARLGDPLGMDVERTAGAILSVVNQNMARRMRLLSIERGHDPREFVLVAFGGGGPLHGAALMREVGLQAMLVPPYPGVLCAMGCAIADLRYDFSQTVNRRVVDVSSEQLGSMFAHQIAKGEAQLRDAGATIDRVTVACFADLAYMGQMHSLRVRIEPQWSHEQIEAAFVQRYRLEYGGASLELPVMLFAVRSTVTGLRPRSPSSALAVAEAQAPPRPSAHRPVHFDTWVDTPVYTRSSLAPGCHIDGPAIVEQADTTTVVEPAMTLRVDRFGNLLVEASKWTQ